MRIGALVLAVLSSAGCFIDPYDRGRVDAAALPAAERRALEETEAFVSAELAAWRAGRSGPERLERAARALGASGGAELAELAARDCLDGPGVERFASARGMSVPTAGLALGRLGVRVCRR